MFLDCWIAITIFLIIYAGSFSAIINGNLILEKLILFEQNSYFFLFYFYFNRPLYKAHHKL